MMRPVRGPDGDPLVVLERPAGPVVYDPRAGERVPVAAEDLEDVDADPLAVAATALPADLPVAGAGGGVLVDLAVGARSVRGMLESYGRCESDLHGILAELAAAGFVAETDVRGRRGYELTEAGREALR